MGYIADIHGIDQIYRIVSLLPLMGIMAALLPKVEQAVLAPYPLIGRDVSKRSRRLLFLAVVGPATASLQHTAVDEV